MKIFRILLFTPILMSVTWAWSAERTVDSIPYASGQVIQMVSSNQNGRSITYRALVVRAGAEPERNLNLVLQKIRQIISSTGKFSNKLIDELVIPTQKLPSGKEAVFKSLEWGEVNDTAAFIFTFDTGVCTFNFDGSGTGTELKLEYFSCKK